MDFFPSKHLEEQILDAWQKLSPEDILKKVKNSPNLSQLLFNNLNQETNPSLYEKFKLEYKENFEQLKAGLQETIEASHKPQP